MKIYLFCAWVGAYDEYHPYVISAHKRKEKVQEYLDTIENIDNKQLKLNKYCRETFGDKFVEIDDYNFQHNAFGFYQKELELED